MMRSSKEFDFIKFGMASQPFFTLSPYHFCTYSLGGKKWRTLVHYWVASYFKDEEMREIVRRYETPDIAVRVGRKYGLSDFDKVDPKNILAAIQAKFNQCDGVRGILLGTGNIELIYTVPGFLSENNRYGKILMKVRELYVSK